MQILFSTRNPFSINSLSFFFFCLSNFLTNRYSVNVWQVLPTPWWDGKGGLLWGAKARIWRSQARTLRLPEGKTDLQFRKNTERGHFMYNKRPSNGTFSFCFGLRLVTICLLAKPERRLYILTGFLLPGQVNNLNLFSLHTIIDITESASMHIDICLCFLLALYSCCSSSSVFGHSCVWTLRSEQAGGLHRLEAFLRCVAAQGEIP